MSDSKTKAETPPVGEDAGAQAEGGPPADADADAPAGDSDAVTSQQATPPRKKLDLRAPPRPLFSPVLPPVPGATQPPPAPLAPPVPGITPGPPLLAAPVPELDGDGEAEGPTPSEQTERTPLRLPTPGVWGKQAPHDAVIDFVRREDADAFFERAAESAAEDDDAGAPSVIHPQDTQALIASMAEEIEEVAEAHKAAEQAARERVLAEQALLEQPTILYDPGARTRPRRSSLGWLAIGATAIAGIVLIGWSMVPGDPARTTAPERAEEAPAVASMTAPKSAQGTVPRPTPPVHVPEPPAPVTDDQTGAGSADEGTTGGPEPALELAAPDPSPPAAPSTPSHSKPSSKSSKAAKPAKSSGQGPSPATKPAAPAAKSADELLREAKKANAGGDASKAYSLASQSFSKSKNPDAAREMVLAACKLKSVGKAKSALQKVRLLDRRSLKQRCKSLGVEL